MSRIDCFFVFLVAGCCAAREPYAQHGGGPDPAVVLFSDLDGSSAGAAGAPEGGTGGNLSLTKASCDLTGSATKSKSAQPRLVVPKIIGGSPAEFPWVVAITSDGTERTARCGGSLIGEQWVLTAAHCAVQAGEKVVVGTTDLTKVSATNVVAVTQVLTNTQYNDVTHDNDIALLKLEKPVTNVEPIELFDGSTNLAGEATVSGWGVTSEGGNTLSGSLLAVEVPLVDNKQCSADYKSDRVTITDNMLCAGATAKDSCQGDSGGPIAYHTDDGRWQQIGIVSFGDGCGETSKPGVYTRVSNYIPWIKSCGGVEPTTASQRLTLVTHAPAVATDKAKSICADTGTELGHLTIAVKYGKTSAPKLEAPQGMSCREDRPSASSKSLFAKLVCQCNVNTPGKISLDITPDIDGPFEVTSTLAKRDATRAYRQVQSQNILPLRELQGGVKQSVTASVPKL